jgi:TRAP-type C4-dicarboxylate transport system permease small subunit
MDITIPPCQSGGPAFAGLPNIGDNVLFTVAVSLGFASIKILKTGEPVAMNEDSFHRLGLKLKFVYSLVGLLLGLACILVGAWLCLRGITGHSTWAVSTLGLSSNLNDASPGVVVFVIGMFVVLITRFQVRTEKYQVPMVGLDQVAKPGQSFLTEKVLFAEEREPAPREKISVRYSRAPTVTKRG